MSKNRPKGLKYNIKVRNKGWFKKGMRPWNTGTKGICKANSGSFKKGEHISPETEFKQGDNIREKNPKWKGGIGSYRRWMKQKKIEFICSQCGYQKKEKLIHLHHIDSDRTNNKEDNLETLCIWCHLSKHLPNYSKRICVAQ